MIKQACLDKAIINANVITVTPYTGGGRGFGPGGGGESGASLNITQSQLQDIIQVAGANTVIPFYSTSDRITVGSKEGRASIIGLPPDKVQDLIRYPPASIADGKLPNVPFQFLLQFFIRG